VAFFPKANLSLGQALAFQKKKVKKVFFVCVPEEKKPKIFIKIPFSRGQWVVMGVF